MKWIKAVILFLLGCFTGGLLEGKNEENNRRSQLKSYKKYEYLYHLMHQWMTVHEMGISVSDLLVMAGYKRIAIYGMADVGKHLYHALRDSEIEICYGIDRGKCGKYENIEIKKPEEDLEEVDAIVVTAVVDYEEIKNGLQKKIDTAIVSLEEILYEGAWR